jgi:hypothetical protein
MFPTIGRTDRAIKNRWHCIERSFHSDQIQALDDHHFQRSIAPMLNNHNVPYGYNKYTTELTNSDMVQSSRSSSGTGCIVSYILLLCYAILYHPTHTMLYYTTLYYAIPCYDILCYTVLYHTVLYHTILLYYTILYYTVLYHAIFTILIYTELFHNTIYYNQLY